MDRLSRRAFVTASAAAITGTGLAAGSLALAAPAAPADYLALSLARDLIALGSVTGS